MAMAPAGLNQEELLKKACAAYREQARDLSAAIANKLEGLRYYDVPAMERAVAICSWGSSGSILLASYLDGHDDVVMLPIYGGSLIYQFLERYPSLALRDKLIAYPVYYSLVPGNYFFGGQFPIASAEYYAAVEALCEAYRDWPAQYLLSRRAFFQFLHVAYSLALGRQPASPHPLMVYQQHNWNATLAAHFVQDFPQARFIHTVRDPITALDRTFESWFAAYNLFPLEFPQNANFMRTIAAFVTTSAIISIHTLIKKDQAHPGMESRTRGIRFEDLHNNTADTLAQLVGWLDLRYQSSLLESTFNGRPYIVERKGKVWSGPRPEQALRSRCNISFTDQTLLFAVLNENFVVWNYPHPKGFRHALARILAYLALCLIPMKIEIIVARAVVKSKVLPSLRRGEVGFAAVNLFRLIGSRLAIMLLLGGELCRRLIFGQKVLNTQIIGPSESHYASSLNTCDRNPAGSFSKAQRKSGSGD